ncbi:fibronectin type III domain-containing protein [Bizionia sp.]|uniref:fibronectin type III domain-containing protein n=1 Tax=Bizionia sp. TaxID=1954480 RepID=UPI003A92E698
MLLMQQQELSGEVLPELNTFIGGVGASIPDATSMAAKLNLLNTSTPLSPSDIQNFSIDVNGNVKFLLETDSEFTSFFDGKTDVNYVVHTSTFLKRTKLASFRNTPNLKIFQAESVYKAGAGGGSAFRNSGLINIDLPLHQNSFDSYNWDHNDDLEYVRLSTTTALGNFQTFNQATSLKRLYIPVVTGGIGLNVGAGNIFNDIALNATIYVHPSMMTINAGNLEGDLAYAQTTRFATIVPVTDFTAPSAVSDLSVSNITTTTVDLDFTLPSSTNALDFYEVWLERTDLDYWHKDRVIGRYSINQEITASGATITGLTSGVPYEVRIVACDEFWNRSGFSNTATFITL